MTVEGPQGLVIHAFEMNGPRLLGQTGKHRPARALDMADNDQARPGIGNASEGFEQQSQIFPGLDTADKKDESNSGVQSGWEASAKNGFTNAAASYRDARFGDAVSAGNFILAVIGRRNHGESASYAHPHQKPQPPTHDQREKFRIGLKQDVVNHYNLGPKCPRWRYILRQQSIKPVDEHCVRPIEQQTRNRSMERQGAVLYIGAVENLLGRPRIEGINNKDRVGISFGGVRDNVYQPYVTTLMLSSENVPVNTEAPHRYPSLQCEDRTVRQGAILPAKGFRADSEILQALHVLR